jgi:hypothetical protein
MKKREGHDFSRAIPTCYDPALAAEVSGLKLGVQARQENTFQQHTLCATHAAARHSVIWKTRVLAGASSRPDLQQQHDIQRLATVQPIHESRRQKEHQAYEWRVTPSAGHSQQLNHPDELESQAPVPTLKRAHGRRSRVL